jgi:hypothetical protein
MVYHDIQTVFVQITKTASSSVHSLLGNERELSLPLLHLRYNKAVSDELINGLDVSNYYNFSTVRNPYDRYVSSYFFMKKIYNWNRDFDENLDELLNKPQNWWDNTFILLRPQWWFVCNHDTYEIEVDEIYKYETINSDWPTIANKINTLNPGANISTTLPTVNVTPGRESWETYYTGTLGEQRAKKVEQLYNKDFEVFNYSKLIF